MKQVKQNVFGRLESDFPLKKTSHYSWPKQSFSQIMFSLGKILTPVLPKLKSFIKVDKKIFKKLLRNLHPNVILLTYDTISLYTINLNEPGLRALIYQIAKYRNLIPVSFSKKFIL